MVDRIRPEPACKNFSARGGKNFCKAGISSEAGGETLAAPAGKIFRALFALALAASSAAAAAAQQPDEGVVVRGAFVTTRPGGERREERPQVGGSASVETATKQPAVQPAAGQKVASAPQRGRRRGARTRPTAAAETAKKGTPPATAQPAATHAAAATVPAVAVAEAAKPVGIGLGYTLFMRDEAGGAVRVNSRREFRSGESVRLVLEANTDGFLYIFNSENDAEPRMLYPHAKLDRGANLIRAHVPYEIPSSREADERLRWFVFDERPATERLYVIVTRRPLEGVPSGEELVRLCAESGGGACAWAPAAEQWARLKASNEREQVATSRAADDGRVETQTEREAATRGLNLSADAPLPSVIHMISSSNAAVLVATIDLVHKGN
jgi:Domain of unknown function (DUF4384)